MVDTSTQIDLGGNDLIVNNLLVGATGPGQTGSTITPTEIGFIDGVTAGTATASKALVLNSSKGIATITSATITTLTSTTANISDVVSPTNLTLNGTTTGTIGIGSVSTGRVTITPVTTITGLATLTAGVVYGATATTKSNKSAVTCTSNAATTTTQYTVVTTESLSTAHTAAQAIVITLVGVASGDMAIATLNGGTNTQGVPVLKAVCTTDTITITIQNCAIATNAFNGTFVINLQWLKA